MAELELEPLGALELEALPPLEGWSLDGAAELDEDDGADEEPDAAEPLMEPEGAGAVVLDEDDEPPEAWSFFWMSIEVDEELEPEGAALELDGEVVVPEAELEDEPGAAVEPDGEVVVDELDEAGVRGLLLSPQPATTAAPNAMETASARVESFMRPPWLGQ